MQNGKFTGRHLLCALSRAAKIHLSIVQTCAVRGREVRKVWRRFRQVCGDAGVSGQRCGEGREGAQQALEPADVDAHRVLSSAPAGDGCALRGAKRQRELSSNGKLSPGSRVPELNEQNL